MANHRRLAQTPLHQVPLRVGRRGAQDQGLPLDYNHDKRLNELLSGNDDPAENLEEIAKLFGQPPDKKGPPTTKG